MMSDLKPYPAYRPSNLEWLGDVPMNWDVQRCKTFMQPVDVRSTRGDEELLTVSAKHGVIPRKSANVTMFRAESYEGYKLCWPGDLVINSLWAWARGLGVSKYHGIVSSAYGVYRLLPRTQGSERYIHYLARSSPFQWELQVRSKGIWTSRLQLTDESFLNSPIPFPSPEEQTAIVRYLDHADSRIQSYISAKERLIELLTEQKQALINQAVTRGLDPNVPLKPSGVEWLGDMPAHWEAVQMGRVGTFFKASGGTKEDETSTGVPCIRYGDLYTTHSFLIRSSRAFVSQDMSKKYTPIKYGDILFAGSGETIEEIGKSAANLIESPVCCGGDVILFRPRVEIDARFSGYLADCHQSQYQKSCMGRGFTIAHIYINQLKYMWLGLPPLSEQIAISEYLDEATEDVASAIDRTKRQIELMQEYRTRLIGDVVTGKLDVRGAVAD